MRCYPKHNDLIKEVNSLTLDEQLRLAAYLLERPGNRTQHPRRDASGKRFAAWLAPHFGVKMLRLGFREHGAKPTSTAIDHRESNRENHRPLAKRDAALLGHRSRGLL